MAENPDARGLIREAFAIEGITASECRSIFLDWALGVNQTQDTKHQIRALIAQYSETADPAHPMMVTLHAALQDIGPPRRRGGRQGRFDPQ